MTVTCKNLKDSIKEYDVFYWPYNPDIIAVQIIEAGFFRFGELSWWERR